MFQSNPIIYEYEKLRRAVLNVVSTRQQLMGNTREADRLFNFVSKNPIVPLNMMSNVMQHVPREMLASGYEV